LLKKISLIKVKSFSGCPVYKISRPPEMGCIQPGILPFNPDGDQFALKQGGYID
jgi:uncharacterized protein YrrD